MCGDLWSSASVWRVCGSKSVSWFPWLANQLISIIVLSFGLIIVKLRLLFLVWYTSVQRWRRTLRHALGLHLVVLIFLTQKTLALTKKWKEQPDQPSKKIHIYIYILGGGDRHVDRRHTESYDGCQQTWPDDETIIRSTTTAINLVQDPISTTSGDTPIR